MKTCPVFNSLILALRFSWYTNRSIVKKTIFETFVFFILLFDLMCSCPMIISITTSVKYSIILKIL